MKRLTIVLSLISLMSTGCQGLLHELQPHRLWRLNYQEPAGRTDGVYFSVSDDLQPIEVEKNRESDDTDHRSQEPVIGSND